MNGRLNRTNCLNCGALLHYDKTVYGRTCTCEYCKTEYHIDEIGEVEEYTVKLKINGKIHKFYISDLEIHNLYNDSCRDLSGRLYQSKIGTKMKAKIIEY